MLHFPLLYLIGGQKMRLWPRAGTRRRSKGGQGLQKPPRWDQAIPAAASSLECRLGRTRVSPSATQHKPDPRACTLGHQPETAVLGTLGQEFGGQRWGHHVPSCSCTAAAEPAGPISCGQKNLAVPQQDTSQLWANGEAGKSAWPGAMDGSWLSHGVTL